MAWSRKQATDFFNTHVMPAVFPGWHAAELEQRRVRYKPGRECRVHYGLRISDGERSEDIVATATFRPGDESAEVAQLRDASSGAGPHVFVPEYSCLVEFFPADFRLPGLALAADPARLTEYLRTSGGGHLGTARVTSVRTICYRPGFSCVFGYSMESETPGPREVIGKLHKKSDVASGLRTKLEVLSPQAAEAGLTIPRLLHWSEQDHLVLMERVPGTNMDRLLFNAPSQDEALATIDLAAEALARFHGLHLDAPVSRTFESEYRRVRRRLRRTGGIAGGLARRAREVLLSHDLSDMTTPEDELGVIHSDFKPDQLLIDDGRTSLIDLDGVCRGDPAIDVGNFMAALRKQAVVNGYADFPALADAFYQAYFARRPSDAIAKRARAFQGVALVRMTLAKFERTPRSYARQGNEWPWLAVLDEAKRCLAEL
jgi:Ser/Thr protein kinase RdoA (MazF antagonist)